MKKWTRWSALVLLAAVLFVAGCAGSGGTQETENGGEGAQGAGDGEEKTVTVFQFKTEIVEGLNELAAEFEKEHPGINIDIQTVGGGADYGAALKTKFASGQEPDIFSNGGYRELDMWLEHLEDLSDQPWAEDIIPEAKEGISKDGKIYGLPVGLEGWGFIYNKDLFEQAGIAERPRTLSELEAAAQKLRDAGITPFANAYQEWWLIGAQGVNVPFAHQEDPDAFIQGLSDGSASIPGNPEFEKWARLLDLTMEYGNDNPLTTDYNTQVTMFANGQAAMMQEGNWAQVQLDQINPELNLGVLPMAIGEDPEKDDRLNVGIPANWVIHKNSPVKEEAKQFLNWMHTSEIGKRYIVEEFKFIPALKTIQSTPEQMGDIAAEIWNYAQDGKVLKYHAQKFPDGVTQEFASAIQAYLAGQSDANQLFEQMQNAWDQLTQ